MAEARDTHAGHAPAADDRSTGALLGDLTNEVSNLFRKELQLFRAELGERTNQVVTALALIAAGIVLLLPGLNAVMAFVIGLIAAIGIGTGWAALIAGIVAALIGYGLVKGGISKLRTARLSPDRTMHSLDEDRKTAREIAR